MRQSEREEQQVLEVVSWDEASGQRQSTQNCNWSSRDRFIDDLLCYKEEYRSIVYHPTHINKILK